MYMKIYPHSDPLTRLIAALAKTDDRSLRPLLKEVCQQYYLQPCALVAKAVELAGFIVKPFKKEAC